ncbi:ribonuclease D [Arsukibacterium sp.]|uniref:ribonuclease D n=1 Tax=Arsukibacterium sp. TaxID=1977258 RepID=UPI00299D7F1F|nr:ribonuclease D [Arsukibacterium sp.]MDX1676295.1 ribonuclease D [Arsukibacterium sp.]
MSYLLTDNLSLAQYCQHAASQPVLAVDSEFIRQSTLYPKLGLIQLFDGKQLALIDPLAITDWQPLAQLFADETIVKTLHSCTEDLEALATIGITHIQPLFDTQLAAELLGWGSSIGYARLVEQATGQVLDKSESRTDWLARPLAAKQLEYAANDVTYLLPLYQHLMAQFTNPAHLPLLLAEGQQLQQRRANPLPARFKYLEMKNSSQLRSRELAVLRELVAWRLEYAASRDLALGLVIKDFQLLELAKRKPGSVESLLNIPGLASRDLRRHAKTLIDLIELAKQLPQENCPQAFYYPEHFPGEKAVLAELTQAVKDTAAETAIPAAFISIRRQMHEYFNWCWRVTDEERVLLPIPEYLTGWRQQLLLPRLPRPAQVSDIINDL